MNNRENIRSFNRHTGEDIMNRLIKSGYTPANSMQATLSVRTLAAENNIYSGSCGVSAENREYGFRPAYLDQASGIAYLSCFANGCAAPVHILDGLPDELVTKRNARGCVTAIRTEVIAGFLRDSVFYTREQAAHACSH